MTALASSDVLRRVRQLLDGGSRRVAPVAACVAAATLLRLAIDPFVHDQVAYVPYLAAVVLTTWLSGVAGGLLAVFVSAPTANYLFAEPRFEFVPHAEDLWAMAVFMLVAFVLVWLVGRWRRAERALRVHALALAEADRVKDQFLATVSHELRTPLNAIVGWADLMRTGSLDRPGEAHAIEVIANNARRQGVLIEELFDISRIVSGRMRIDPATLDARLPVASAVEAVMPSARAKRIDLAVSLGPGPCLVFADETRLQQVVWNVLANAVKFTPADGRVSVAVEHVDDLIHIIVADNGRGIDKEFLPHVFDRFVQADFGPARSTPGLGLGLAIVRYLVEAHGGRVRAESDGPGRGARFVVSLPCASAVVPAMGAATQSAGAFPALPLT